MLNVALLVLIFPLLVQEIVAIQPADRTNFVLMVSEDNSIHFMDHFFPVGAKTPNNESLADGGITEWEVIAYITGNC